MKNNRENAFEAKTAIKETEKKISKEVPLSFIFNNVQMEMLCEELGLQLVSR